MAAFEVRLEERSRTRSRALRPSHNLCCSTTAVARVRVRRRRTTARRASASARRHRSLRRTGAPRARSGCCSLTRERSLEWDWKWMWRRASARTRRQAAATRTRAAALAFVRQLRADQVQAELADRRQHMRAVSADNENEDHVEEVDESCEAARPRLAPQECRASRAASRSPRVCILLDVHLREQ